MAFMRMVVVLFAAVFVLSSCGDGGEPAASSATVTATATETVTITATNTVAPSPPTINETCDAAAAALKHVKFRVPSRYQPTVAEAIPDLAKVLATAPPRLEAPLDGMLNAMIRFAGKDPADGAGLVDGASAFLQSIKTLTHACGRD